MSAVLACLACFVLYFLGYRFYSRYLAEKVFALDASRKTPAHRLRNDVDYLPTNRFVLFGHHFASITGLSPMLGPAIAVIWGWAPAMIWVVFGALLIGCVHDFSALVVSLRAKGQSIGKVAEGVVGPRAKALFLAIIFFGVALAMGVFAIVIAGLFSSAYGTAVIPSGGLMVVAGVIGWLSFKKGLPLGRLAIAGFVVQLLLVWAGAHWPIIWVNKDGWITVLLIYAFLASVLPVWSLLQPRDFLNSLLLYLGLGLCYAGFMVIRPEFAAPAFDADPEGAPDFYPFVFITIACGAASGFHSLVSSGTTSKQLDSEPDARMVGYGGMIGESLLGLLAVLATTAGFTMKESDPSAAWHRHYASWDTAQGLTAKMGAFIDGSAQFLEGVGISAELGTAFIAVIVVSFALTTLDSATRLLRYNVEEIAQSIGAPWLGNRYLASVIAVLAIGFFAFYKIDPDGDGPRAAVPAGLSLWQIFGTVNQLLAGLALLVATLYLRVRGRNAWVTGIPMVFMLVTTLLAMAGNLSSFSFEWTFDAPEGQAMQWPLFIVACLLAILGIWLIIEAGLTFMRIRRDGIRIDDPEVFPD